MPAAYKRQADIIDRRQHARAEARIEKEKARAGDIVALASLRGWPHKAEALPHLAASKSGE